MEKKNLLFVIPSLAAGGGEKSLVNLLSRIDYDLYNVDLFLFDHKGIFMDFLPQQVSIVPIPKNYNLFSLPLKKSLISLLLRGKLLLAVNRLVFSFKNRFIKDVSIREQYTWKNLSSSLNKLDKNYDAAIGFLEKTSIYFCVDKVASPNKIGWIHNDYDELGMDPDFDIEYFKKLSSIFTVSEKCKNIFGERFPDQQNKIFLMYNIVSPSLIHKMASLEKRNVYHKKENESIILTIGRLHYQKGLEMAVESCKKLLKKGYNIKWFIIGEGDERQKLLKLIQLNHLEKNFILLGLKSNPYPYISQADIYVQPSRFEGKSIALDEAKILHKPIVVTNFSTAKDQIKDGKEGLIVEMNSDSIAQGIERILLDKNLSEQLKTNLSKLKLGTEDEVEKLYKVL